MASWTWKDTLLRINYIDTVSNDIVHNAILLNTIFFAAFAVLHSQESYRDNWIAIRCTYTAISIGGLFINLFLAKFLARQEYIRQWYFSLFPKNMPLMPDYDWLKDAPIGFDKYDIEYLESASSIEKPNRNLWIIKLGKMGPGHCVTWIYILLIIAAIFLYLSFASWWL